MFLSRNSVKLGAAETTERRGVVLQDSWIEEGGGPPEPVQVEAEAEQARGEAGQQHGESDGPVVVLSRAFALAHHRPGKRLKRTGFLAAIGVANAGVAFGTLALARFLVDGVLLSEPYFWLCAVSSVAVGVMTIRSRPDSQRAAGGFLEEWIEAGREALIVGMLLVILAFFWRPGLIRGFAFSRGTVLASIPMLFVLLAVARSIERMLLLELRVRGHNLASVVVIGDGASAASFIQTIHDESGTGYRVVAHIPDPGPTHDIAPVLRRLSHTINIHEVVIASFGLSASQVEGIVEEPAMRGVRIRAVPELFGLPPSKVQMISFADFPLLTLFENPVRGPRWKLKRAIDVAVAVLALLVLSPFLAAIAIAIRYSSEGGVFFRQLRLGMDAKPIKIIKFRTMVSGASETTHREFMRSMLVGEPSESATQSGFYKMTDDARITRVGRFLRRYSLDELPQLMNVIAGDMSLVGPRPAIPYEVEFYEEWQRRRFDVLPGMTGLWQVSGRSRLSPADMLRLDVHYAETWSLPNDFLIILRTIPAILRNDAC